MTQRRSIINTILFLGVVFLSSLNEKPVLGASQSLGGVVLTEVAPRIVTPNGDMLNDVIFFRFDSALSGLPVETAILDLHGAKVAEMTLDTNETALLWNGKGDSNQNVPTGIYVYSIKLGKNLATGTVVVAR